MSASVTRVGTCSLGLRIYKVDASRTVACLAIRSRRVGDGPRPPRLAATDERISRDFAPHLRRLGAAFAPTRWRICADSVATYRRLVGAKTATVARPSLDRRRRRATVARISRDRRATVAIRSRRRAPVGPVAVGRARSRPSARARGRERAMPEVERLLKIAANRKRLEELSLVGARACC